MPPKGRNKPTPMVMFMNELRDEMEYKYKKKFKVPFDEALYELCKPIYDELSEDQKQHYKDLAKSEWTGIRDDKNKKLTSGGESVAVVERREQEKKLKIKIENMEIEKQLNFDTNTILPMEFVVIHVNWFCKISDDSFVPAEVALARFSLQEGFIDAYHCFPQFDFPPGTKGESKAHSERTHQIPIYDFSEKLEKWPIIFRDIVKFLSKGNTNSLMEGNCFPLYTMNDDVNDITSRNAVRCFLNLITSSANYSETFSGDNPHEKYFKLYNLAKLYSELKLKDLAMAHHVSMLDENALDLTLRKDMFLQSRNIACQWHDDRDLIPKCSRSRCLSWIFIVCEQCQFMNYPMLPGRHMPNNAILDTSSVYDDDDLLSERQFEDESEYGYDCDDTGSVASSYHHHERGLTDQMRNISLNRRQY